MDKTTRAGVVWFGVAGEAG